MIRLRPFKLSDSKHLIKWTGDEYAFAQWCANKFTYPLTQDQILSYHQKCENDDNAWIMTALNHDGTPVGHLLLRMADYLKESVHFGFIIIDSQMRGKGYGKEMVSLAVKYAFEILKVKQVTLGVFDNNSSAHDCYKGVGFVDVKYQKSIFPFGQDKWGLYDMVIKEQ